MKKTKENGSNKIKIVLSVILILFMAGILYVCVSLYTSKNALVVDTFQYNSEKIEQDINLVALSDIHSHLFGTDNERLIRKVEALKPDAVLVVGDGINYYDKDHSYLNAFVERLLRIAPVYFTVGNHEVAQMSRTKDYTLTSDLQSLGAIVLDMNYEDVIIQGEEFRIGGLFGNAYNSGHISTEEYIASDNYRFLEDFEATDSFKLMLSHQPDSFIPDTEDTKWDIDLVVSGHEHGGQVRLPFIGAVYSPHAHMGWFPEYADGTHVINGIPMIISRGLGTYEKQKNSGGAFVPPRFDNIPEIVNIQIN